MTRYDAALVRLAAWAGLSQRRSVELVHDARAAAGPHRRRLAGELLSVAGLVVTLRARRATGDEPVRVLRQGARAGALVAGALAVPLLASHGLDTGRPGLVALVAPGLLGMVVARHGDDARRCVLAGAGALATLAVGATGMPMLLATLLLVAHGGLALGECPEPDPRLGGRGGACRAAAALGATAMLAITGATLDTAAVTALASWGAAGAAIALLLAARLDARLAVAATVVLVARFGTLERDDLGALAGRPAAGADPALLTLSRLVLMLAFVGAGVAVARTAVRHVTRP